MNCINPRPALGVVGTRFLLESAPLRNSKTLPLRRRSLPGPRSARAAARCTDHHQRLAALVLRRQTHLVAVELERDHARLALGCENKRVPIDGDLARADAEESAEVDDGRMDPAVPAAAAISAVAAIAVIPRPLLMIVLSPPRPPTHNLELDACDASALELRFMGHGYERAKWKISLIRDPGIAALLCVIGC